MRKNPPIPSENLNDLHDIMTFMTHHVFGNLTGTCPLSDIDSKNIRGARCRTR